MGYLRIGFGRFATVLAAAQRYWQVTEYGSDGVSEKWREYMNENKGNNVCKHSLFVFCLLMVTSLWVGSAWADETAELSQKVLEKWQDAVITARIIIEMYESERKIEILVTVIDKSGLAVLSLSSINPASMYGAMVDETKVKDVTMILPDNEEIPANLVLRDQDIDLAFIKPIDKVEKKLTAIDLGDNTEPEILDRIVSLSRLGNTGGFAPVVSISRVQAIIKKPRTMYMIDPMKALLGGLGVPAFTLDGKIVGIALMRTSKVQDVMGDELSRGMGGLPSLPIILPAQEIIDVIERAGLD